MTQKRFYLMTFGRTGSTWLIDAIAQLPDVAVPAKNVKSQDNELLTKGMGAKYAELVQAPVRTDEELIDAFFRVNAASPFAGFKSMPERHQQYDRFIARPDLAFLTLERRDLYSALASFLMARRKGTWRRFGGTPEQTLRFTEDDRPIVRANVSYIIASRLKLAAIPRALRLFYEDLCQPGFENARLDAYFGRPVRLPAPKPATAAQDYVENWDEFRTFARATWQEALKAAPASVQALFAGMI